MLAFGAIALAMGASVAQAETMSVQGELLPLLQVCTRAFEIPVLHNCCPYIS